MPLRHAKEAAAKSHLTVAFWGPPKTGKTLTALITAQALAEGRRFAVLDTERNGSLLYAPHFDFDVENELADYSPQSYLNFLAQVDGKYPVIVLDSISHAWEGRGGVLEIAERVGAKAGGSPFGGWSIASPEQHRFVDALLTTRSHLIVTMRAKTAWEIRPNERGKLQPYEVGQEAVQRQGIRYEFDALFMCEDPQRNLVSAMGSRLYCADGGNLLANYVKEKPGPELGQMMLAWLRSGAGDRASVLAGMLRARLGADAEPLIAMAQSADDLQRFLDGLR